MKVKELFKQVNRDALLRMIQTKYPEERMRVQTGFYDNLLNRLEKAETGENEDHQTLHVEFSKDFGVTNPEFIWNASYSTHRRYNHKYSLKFVTIEEVASFFVLDKDIEEQSVLQYFAHLFYEMTHSDVLDDADEDFNCIVEKGVMA